MTIPPPLHEGQHRPTATNEGQRRPMKAHSSPQQPTKAHSSQHQRRPTKAHSSQRNPTTATDSQRRPTAANEGQRRPTKVNAGPLVNQLSENSEIWILGDDNAIGIGALGIAACIIAETPNFIVRSLLFQNDSFTAEAREEIVQSLRRTPSLLEQRLKYSGTGDVFVCRLVYNSIDTQPRPAPGVAIESPLANGQISAYFPPTIKATDVQVSADFFGIDNISADKPSTAFVGKVSHMGAEVKDISAMSKVR